MNPVCVSQSIEHIGQVDGKDDSVPEHKAAVTGPSYPVTCLTNTWLLEMCKGSPYA